MDDIKKLKLMCRKAAFIERLKAHKMSLDSKANAQLINYLKAQKDNLIISAYMPIRTEISPLTAMNAMVRRGRIVCVPVVIADGSRLGYGGGYYDRSFAKIKKTKNVQAIGFAYSAQEVMLVPRENTDYQLNSIITEQGILSF